MSNTYDVRAAALDQWRKAMPHSALTMLARRDFTAAAVEVWLSIGVGLDADEVTEYTEVYRNIRASGMLKGTHHQRDFDHAMNLRCYHCGRPFVEIEEQGSTPGCICDPADNVPGADN